MIKQFNLTAKLLSFTGRSMKHAKFTTVKQVAKCLDIFTDNQQIIRGTSVDTRTLQPGELYFALKGARVDGHSFLAEASFKGASGAIVAKSYKGPNYGLPLLYVDDPLQALQELAKRLIAHWKTRIIAITGSLGKTTTKEFLETLLGTKYRIFASPGNSNSQIGLPLALLNHTTGEEEILVLEMGMTHPGNLTRLVQIAPPEVAIMTTVALVHAWNFNSLNDIGRAKAEIFSHPSTRLGFFHYDVGYGQDWLNIGSCHKLSFSTHSPAAHYYLSIQDSSFIVHSHLEHSQFKLRPLHLPGKHNAHNLLAAMAVARHFNLSWDEISEAIPLLKLPERRLQFVEHKGILFLNDSYNAAELSVKSALESIPSPKGEGRKIAVLGSMMELGQFSVNCHYRVGEYALEYVEKLYCLGEECQPMYDLWKKQGKPVKLFLNRAELVHTLQKELKPLDVVLLKGSRSKELWKILEEL